MRVVSVLPSATETVCALGRAETLVGRSAECDYPPEVTRLPVVMRARTLDADRPSAEIDARVRRSIERGESLYELDVAALARLRPELLLTQDLCRVCSVTDAEVVEACRAAGVSPRILSISPTRLAEVWAGIERIASALGVADRGRRLADELRARTAPAAAAAEGRRVAVLEWIDPPIESGLWTPELVRSAGGEPWSAEAGAPAPRVAWEALAARPPELTIVSPCAFSVARSLRELRSSELGRRLRAARVPRGVWVADESYFSRPGPRLAAGRELVRALLQGEAPPDGAPVERWSPPTGGAS